MNGNVEKIRKAVDEIERASYNEMAKSITLERSKEIRHALEKICEWAERLTDTINIIK